MRVHRLSLRHVGVVEERPSGFGPRLWVGEVRTLHDDKRIAAWHDGSLLPDGRRHIVETYPAGGKTLLYPVSAAPTELELLAALRRRVRLIENRLAWSAQ